jgi:hypothetical protein
MCCFVTAFIGSNKEIVIVVFIVSLYQLSQVLTGVRQQVKDNFGTGAMLGF